MMNFVTFLQLSIDGLLTGGIYVIVSIGLSLVFGVMHIVNFAHAEFLMLGMFIAWFAWSWLGLDPMLGAFLSLALVFVLGMGLQRWLIQPVQGASQMSQIFLTVGLMFMLENGALLLFGADFRSVSTPYQTMGMELLAIPGQGKVLVGLDKVLAFAMAALIGLAVWALVQFSRFGMAIRATAQDPMAAQLMGINTRRVYRIAFGLGVGLTAFGGAVILPYMSVFPTVGTQFAVLMFTAVVLGGLGNVAGAVLGGLLVGVVQSLSTLLLPIQMQNFALFVVFIAVLALRPQGLLSRRAA
ncbi:branched-chain amino acid ABC transporter permease [Xanthobacter dioxanivorans]|uniref:branched-chain amino acid ABC transporter permease n=1 Tax=Xanthobacter dioxanivorans TaxID=2528964 RepID=UPI001E46F13A|nr:branched-chain amino acid ABC transporter permease [Xanthobacter dioxanivorans]